MKNSEIQVLIEPATDMPRGRWRLSTYKLRPDGSMFIPIEGTFDPTELYFLKLIIRYLFNYQAYLANPNQTPLPVLRVNKIDDQDGLYLPLFSVS